jgi:hypothetical protein
MLYTSFSFGISSGVDSATKIGMSAHRLRARIAKLDIEIDLQREL